jgi:hypothetical protein
MEYDLLWDDLHTIQGIYNDMDMVYSGMLRVLSPDVANKHICYMQESLDNALYTRIKLVQEEMAANYPNDTQYNLILPSKYKVAQAWWDVMEQNKVAAKSTVEA